MKNKTHIIIPTYNRPRALRELLQQLDAPNIHVINDGSTMDYGLLKKASKYNILNKNHGKKEYYKVVNFAFEHLKKNTQGIEYVLYLADDLELKPEFWEKLQYFMQYGDIVNVLSDKRIYTGQWGLKPRFKRDYAITSWVDMAFCAKIQSFESINYKITHICPRRWEQNPNASSGVGMQLSMRWHQKTIIHPFKSLTKHRILPSQMNPNERKQNPIIEL